jgi:hypothetical protein
MIRALYISVIFAMCDLCSLSWNDNSVFSHAPFQTGNGDAIYTGFGYTLVNYRDVYFDDGRTYGPEVWFWFTPVVIDIAHGGIQVHWLWDSPWRQPRRRIKDKL